MTHGPQTKPYANCMGSQYIVTIQSDIFMKFEHHITKIRIFFHFCIVKPFKRSKEGTNAEIKKVCSFDVYFWNTTENLMDVLKSNNCFEIFVKWKGLTDKSNPWEPSSVIFKYISTILCTFLAPAGRQKIQNVMTNIGTWYTLMVPLICHIDSFTS